MGLKTVTDSTREDRIGERAPRVAYVGDYRKPCPEVRSFGGARARTFTCSGNVTVGILAVPVSAAQLPYFGADCASIRCRRCTTRQAAGRPS